MLILNPLKMFHKNSHTEVTSKTNFMYPYPKPWSELINRYAGCCPRRWRILCSCGPVGQTARFRKSPDQDTSCISSRWFQIGWFYTVLGIRTVGSVRFWASRIRTQLVTSTDPAPAPLPSISKTSRKNHDFYCFETFLLIFIWEE
jgi:hypothetical protein